jgi:hypothetical protein
VRDKANTESGILIERFGPIFGLPDLREEIAQCVEISAGLPGARQ